MSDVALDSEGNPLVNPFTGLAPVTEPTQGEINRTRIEALNRRIKELTEERDRTEAEERDRTRKFPIDGGERNKYQYLEKKYSNAVARKDKEGQIYYRGEINTLLSGELTNSERSVRIDEKYGLSREGLSPASQKVGQPEAAPSSASQKDQPEQESHGVKIFLIIVYVFLIIGTLVITGLYFSYKEEWLLYIMLGLLALLFILFIVLFYFSFKNSE